MNYEQDARQRLQKQVASGLTAFYYFCESDRIPSIEVHKLHATSVDQALGMMREVGVFIDPGTTPGSSLPRVREYPVLTEIIE